MRKLAFYLLDALIVLVLCWLFFFSNFFESFWTFVVTAITLLVSVAALAYNLARRNELAKQQIRHRDEKLAAHQEAERAAERLRQEQKDCERQELLEREHEARRPVCGHCGKKTQGVFLYRRVDGTPDRRYRDNPLLCYQCLKPYQPIRPWNFPKQTQNNGQIPSGAGEV